MELESGRFTQVCLTPKLIIFSGRQALVIKETMCKDELSGVEGRLRKRDGWATAWEGDQHPGWKLSSGWKGRKEAGVSVPCEAHAGRREGAVTNVKQNRRHGTSAMESVSPKSISKP